jgi:hypothetical protein
MTTPIARKPVLFIGIEVIRFTLIIGGFRCGFRHKKA